MGKVVFTNEIPDNGYGVQTYSVHSILEAMGQVSRERLLRWLTTVY